MYEIDMLEIWWKKEERFTAISTDIKDICKNHLIFVKVMKVTWNTNDSSVLNTDDRKIIDTESNIMNEIFSSTPRFSLQILNCQTLWQWVMIHKSKHDVHSLSLRNFTRSGIPGVE